MLWVAPGADPARALGSVPTECLTRPADPALAARIEVGRAAFRTPVLLGGQAARAGINCETCHRAGRGNPDFHFPGISGAPGTADFTNAISSTHRDDGIDNPKPIPDLSGPKDRLKVDQDPAQAKLEPFLHGLVTEEFDGPEPTPVVTGKLIRSAAPTPPPAAPAAEAAPVAEEVQLTVVSNPPGARVVELSSGRTLGTTPMSASVPRSTTPSRLRLDHAGRKTTEVEVLPDAELEVHVALPKAAKPAAPASGAVARKAKHPDPFKL